MLQIIGTIIGIIGGLIMLGISVYMYLRAHHISISRSMYTFNIVDDVSVKVFSNGDVTITDKQFTLETEFEYESVY